MILFIIFAILALASLLCGLYLTISAVRNKGMEVDYKLLLFKLTILSCSFSISFLLSSIGAVLWNNYPLNGGEWVMLIFGGLLFPFLICIFLFSFIIHYYGKNIEEKLDKRLFVSMCVSAPIAIIVFFYLYTNSFAAYLTYPLVNGINFSQGFVTPNSGTKPNIAFYALCILSGAILVYFLCDHKMYIQYGKHGLLESTFLVAFPAGIIGARIFYCIGVGMPFSEWWRIFDGGLTILGGAITGIVVGVAWFMWRNKGYSIWVAVDIIVPTILIAQAMGRWGNFFNVEVHGKTVSEVAWSFLPGVIWGNAHYGVVGSMSLPEGNIYVPLFLIEGITNLLGYFVLAHVFGKRLRKYTAFGDLAFGYIIWYGLTRVIMEPMRDVVDQMNTWSWYWSFVFVVAGSLLIVANHLIRYVLDKKNNSLKVNANTFKVGLISTLSVIGVGAILLSIALVLTISNPEIPFDKVVGLTLDPHNVGLIVLTIAISLLLGLVITIPKLIDGIKYRKSNEN